MTAAGLADNRMTQNPQQQYHSSVGIADAALRNIGAFGQSADPKSYALWFKYASGDSGLLSAAMNARLTRKGTLNRHDIEQLYGAHIAPGQVGDKPNRIGTHIAREHSKV